MCTAKADQAHVVTRRHIDETVAYASDPAKGAIACLAILETTINNLRWSGIEAHKIGQKNAMFDFIGGIFCRIERNTRSCFCRDVYLRMQPIFVEA